jgi:hypothetical protein
MADLSCSRSTRLICNEPDRTTANVNDDPKKIVEQLRPLLSL